jgi:methionyl-tRNA formyltransferase
VSGAAAVANVYCGTSDFAAGVLRTLAASPHRPRLVVTPPDRPRGRGRKLASPPAADLARELGIEVHQTASINEPESRAAVLAVEPGVVTVCAFGQLIKAPLLGALPMLNVHPSLLPRWRGAAPIERAIMAGDDETGVCVMRLTEGLDSGPVALRERLAVGAAETFGELAPRLAELGGTMLVEALGRWAADELEGRFAEQDEAGVTYAEKIGGAERRIDPARPARQEALRSRALTPHIGTWIALARGERLGVRARAALADGPAAGAFEECEEGLLLGCEPGALVIEEVQPPGGRWMSAADYVRGRGLPDPAE